MSAATASSAAGIAGPDEMRGGRPPRRRRRRVVAVAAAVVVLAAAGAVGYLARPFGGHPRGGVADNGYPTSLVAVVRQSLSAQTSVSGTLGYAGSYTAVNQARGTVTGLPAAGRVVRQGRVLYEVNGQPVVLLYGSVPAYRTLAAGAVASDVTGRDVRQLNRDLVALGYATRSQLSPSSDEFSSATKDAVEKLQAHLGVKQTGSLALGQAVFLPRAVRVTKVLAAPGKPTGPGMPVLFATSTARQVTVALDAAEQSYVKAGDTVMVTLPDGKATPGRVSSVGKVATSSGTPTVTVEVRPLHPAATGTLDQAPVKVAITTATVKNALVVPVAALLALGRGGYAVEVAGPGGRHHLVPVSLGLFDDAAGLVQVSGSGLVAGQRVVVPAS